MSEKSNEVLQMARKILSEEDFLEFYEPNSTIVKKYNIASGYLNHSRNAFFASLDNEFCDVQKAKDFHNTYKFTDVLMTIMATDLAKDTKSLDLRELLKGAKKK